MKDKEWLVTVRRYVDGQLDATENMDEYSYSTPEEAEAAANAARALDPAARVDVIGADVWGLQWTNGKWDVTKLDTHFGKVLQLGLFPDFKTARSAYEASLSSRALQAWKQRLQKWEEMKPANSPA